MGSSGKLDQAKDALSHIISTMRSEDEMFYLRFHLEVDKVLDFTSDPHRILSAIAATAATENGTSLYDAIARALCYMRSARHHRQALLVVTDGADQNSHRSLDDLIPIVQALQAQVFVIGCLHKAEYDVYRKSRKQKIPLVTHQEIDNPLTAFNQLAKESGAESFFPASPEKLQEAVDAVAHQLRTQYTLAYYPSAKGPGFHRIQVKVAQSGARVRTRGGFEGVEQAAGQGPTTQSAGCESVQCRGAVITILFPDTPVAKFEDDEFQEGLVGMILYGAGRAAFPDLLAEDACAAAPAAPRGHAPSQPLPGTKNLPLGLILRRLLPTPRPPHPGAACSG